MIKLINKTTGTPMWVADERVKEYLAAGHKSASEIHAKKPVEETKVVGVEERPVDREEEIKVTRRTSKKNWR